MTVKHGLFSVVTPNYNMAEFLPETIESVLASLQPGDQYFIVDGGSTDGSVEIIRRYESRLSGWVSEPDNGYADALVKGFQRCRGEFLCWINSGDLHLKGALQAARKILTETGTDLIFGDNVAIDKQSRVLFQGRGDVISLRHIMLYGGWTPMQESCFWRRSLYERVGGIDSTLKYGADYDFFLRASWAGRCMYVPKVFGAFRLHEDQKSISGLEQYNAERQSCRRRMLDQLKVSTMQRFAFEPFWWFVVRWRQHIVRRFFYVTWIEAGTHVYDLIVNS